MVSGGVARALISYISPVSTSTGETNLHTSDTSHPYNLIKLIIKRFSSVKNRSFRIGTIIWLTQWTWNISSCIFWPPGAWNFSCLLTAPRTKRPATFCRSGRTRPAGHINWTHFHHQTMRPRACRPKTITHGKSKGVSNSLSFSHHLALNLPKCRNLDTILLETTNGWTHQVLSSSKLPGFFPTKKQTSQGFRTSQNSDLGPACHWRERTYSGFHALELMISLIWMIQSQQKWWSTREWPKWL